MKPLVGVMPLWDEKKDSIWMLPGYLNGLIEAGITPIIFPFLQEEEELRKLVMLCDGILFTGGHDVSPSFYGENPQNGTICYEIRDNMEKIVFDIATKENKSILGICRGLQFINVALGGTLYQDLERDFPSSVNHRQKPPYDLPCHEVMLEEGTPLRDCLGRNRVSVNSAHHQGIKDLAPSLLSMAKSPDGLIEAIYEPTKRFLWAVQWHPEFRHLVDEDSRTLFKAFANSMAK